MTGRSVPAVLSPEQLRSRDPIDSCEQRLAILAAGVTQAVDKEGRRLGDTALRSRDEIVTHARPVRPGGKIVGETARINPCFGRVDEEVIVIERVRIVEQHVVHRPEFALRTGSLDRLGGTMSSGVKRDGWEMPED